jgi:hypothetical protein
MLERNLLRLWAAGAPVENSSASRTVPMLLVAAAAGAAVGAAICRGARS